MKTIEERIINGEKIVDRKGNHYLPVMIYADREITQVICVKEGHYSYLYEATASTTSDACPISAIFHGSGNMILLKGARSNSFTTYNNCFENYGSFVASLEATRKIAAARPWYLAYDYEMLPDLKKRYLQIVKDRPVYVVSYMTSRSHIRREYFFHDLDKASDLYSKLYEVEWRKLEEVKRTGGRVAVGIKQLMRW